ncbi:hypothetical protein LXL04_027470 [Taraxacum kok-saghyz]
MSSDNQFDISHVSTDNQPADVFTKPLSGVKHSEAISNLGVIDIPPSLRGGVKRFSPFIFFIL